MRDKYKLDIALLEELLRNQRKILRKQKKKNTKRCPNGKRRNKKTKKCVKKKHYK